MWLTQYTPFLADEKFAPQPQPVEPQPVEPQPNVFIVFIY